MQTNLNFTDFLKNAHHTKHIWEEIMKPTFLHKLQSMQQEQQEYKLITVQFDGSFLGIISFQTKLLG